jgi:hypothetical protein
MKQAKDTTDNTITALTNSKNNTNYNKNKYKIKKREYENCYKLHTFYYIKNPTRYEAKTSLYRKELRD